MMSRDVTLSTFTFTVTLHRYVQDAGDAHLYTCGGYGIWRVHVDKFYEIGDTKYFTCIAQYVISQCIVLVYLSNTLYLV